MRVIRPDSVPDVIANKCGWFIDTHVRYRTISDNLEEQKIYIFTDNYSWQSAFFRNVYFFFMGSDPNAIPVSLISLGGLTPEYTTY